MTGTCHLGQNRSIFPPSMGRTGLLLKGLQLRVISGEYARPNGFLLSFRPRRFPDTPHARYMCYLNRYGRSTLSSARVAAEPLRSCLDQSVAHDVCRCSDTSGLVRFHSVHALCLLFFGACGRAKKLVYKFFTFRYQKLQFMTNFLA